MRKTSILILFMVLVATILWAQSPQKKTISGRVLDPSDNPIAGVRVQAYRQSQLLGMPSFSNSNGEYSIAFDSGPPVDTVRYDQSDWFPGTVEHVSGKNDQRVFKTLYKHGTPLSYFGIQGTVFAFERVQELDRGKESRQLDFGEYRYRDALEEIDSMIDKLDVPADVKNELRQRIANLKKKYGIATATPFR